MKSKDVKMLTTSTFNNNYNTFDEVGIKLKL